MSPPKRKTVADKKLEVFKTTSWNFQAKEHIKRPRKGQSLCGKQIGDYARKRTVTKEWLDTRQRFVCSHCWKRYKNGELDSMFSCDKSKMVI